RETENRTIGADKFPLWAGPKGWQTACHNPSVIEAMLTGRPYPVRALYASGVNILVSYPDTRRTIEALRSLDFVAVAAHAMTPTAEQADIVLPKTTTLEEEEVSFMPSGPTVLFTRAVVPPQGEARSEIDIALPLLAKMAERRAIATRTGKVELSSPVLEELGLDPLPSYRPPDQSEPPAAEAGEFPLILITGDREKSYHHSRFRDQPWALKVSPDPQLTMHPETARALGLDEGAWVYLEVARGKGACRLRLKLSDATPRHVVNTGMGWWLPGDS